MLTIDWIMLVFCLLVILPWIIGGLLIINDMKKNLTGEKNEGAYW